MKKKEPLFRVVKRESSGPARLAVSYVVAVLVALCIGALLLTSQGVPVGKFYQNVLTMGMVGSKYPFRILEGFIRLFVPLLITSLALSLAFKMKFWNIGGEGQFIMGAICAGVAAYKLGDTLPQPVMILVLALCGIVGGGVYGLIVAVLKVRFGTNETLLTLMLNYVALYLLLFLGETKADWNFFLSADSVRPIFARFPESAGMITFGLGPFQLNLSLVIAVVLCVLIFVYLKYTKQGYEIAVVGDSVGTAHYAGMKVNTIVLRTVFLSACLIGLAAAFKVGTAGILSTAITDDVGWTGIIVAWLSQMNTAIIFLVSALISMLRYGSTVAAATFSQVDSSFANMLQGAILFLVLAADFYTRFRVVPVQKGGKTNGNG